MLFAEQHQHPPAAPPKAPAAVASANQQCAVCNACTPGHKYQAV
jgi:hypothetical protein